MAIVGENGVGKSTVLQCAASVYNAPPKRRAKYGSDFLFGTTWEDVRGSVEYSAWVGDHTHDDSIGRRGDRWTGNRRRPTRHVEYIDLSRVVPVAARAGYTKIVKSDHKEISAKIFEKGRLDRFSNIMGHKYDLARMALTDQHENRAIPVVGQRGATYSGYHQGAGEITVAELLQADLPQYSLVVIDEIESSLHPRTQRRLIRDLAEKCRELEWQVILTTHSSYVLAELPPEARAYIMQVDSSREIIYGVSPEFAMTHMDDVDHPECDLYVEDVRAERMLAEIMAAHDLRVAHDQGLARRCQIIPYGVASTGQALGLMVNQGRFPRRSRVFLDGDRAESTGCINLPGGDAPERVIFEALKRVGWDGISRRVGRDHAVVADSCGRAMALSNHHEWVASAATRLTLAGDILWQAMCAEWASMHLDETEARKVTEAVHDALIGVDHRAKLVPAVHPVFVPASIPAPKKRIKREPSSTAQERLFERLPDAEPE
jgi:predicted ATPase